MGFLLAALALALAALLFPPGIAWQAQRALDLRRDGQQPGAASDPRWFQNGGVSERDWRPPCRRAAPPPLPHPTAAPLRRLYRKLRLAWWPSTASRH